VGLPIRRQPQRQATIVGAGCSRPRAQARSIRSTPDRAAPTGASAPTAGAHDAQRDPPASRRAGALRRLFRRRNPARLRHRRRDRKAAVEDQGRGSSRRRHDRVSGRARQPRLRAALLGGGRRATSPAYECCTFLGGVAALDATTGKVIWTSRVIPDKPQPFKKNTAGTQMYGPAGGAVWSAPTLDLKRNLVLVSTGDSYTDVNHPGRTPLSRSTWRPARSAGRGSSRKPTTHYRLQSRRAATRRQLSGSARPRLRYRRLADPPRSARRQSR